MRNDTTKAMFVLTALLFSGVASTQSARNSVSIVGSSTIHPFTVLVADRLSRAGKIASPRIESNGTGKGLRLFCGGVGEPYPDVAAASRKIKPEEVEACAQNLVRDIVEVKIGYDGIVLARSRKADTLALSSRDLYLALAKQVPDRADPRKMIENPHITWRHVNPALPDRRIEVLGPPASSGTRDAFAELVLERGCDTYSWIKALKETDADRYKRICTALRSDSVYIEAGEDDEYIARKVAADPAIVGIFGYNFLQEHKDKIVGGPLDGFGPTFETIATGRYAASRPLYLYVKRKQVEVVLGLREFIAEYVSEQAIGPKGYLVSRGLIPAGDAERTRIRAGALALRTL